MEISVVQDAVRQLQARGVPLEKVTAPQVRELVGFGSYTSIIEHLRSMRGEAADSREAIDNGSPAHEETALAVPDDTLVDIVQAAEQALAHAQWRLEEAEAQIPELERLVEHAYRQVEEASAVHLRRSYAVSKGALPSDDMGVREAEKAMWDASRAHRQAQERLDEAPRAIDSARGAVRMAQRELFLARERPELVQALVAVQAEDAPDVTQPDAYARYCAWKQRLASARAACEQACAAAGL